MGTSQLKSRVIIRIVDQEKETPKPQMRGKWQPLSETTTPGAVIVVLPAFVESSKFRTVNLKLANLDQSSSSGPGPGKLGQGAGPGPE